MWLSDWLSFPLFVCSLAVCCFLSHYLLTSYLVYNTHHASFPTSSLSPDHGSRRRLPVGGGGVGASSPERMSPFSSVQQLGGVVQPFDIPSISEQTTSSSKHEGSELPSPPRPTLFVPPFFLPLFPPLSSSASSSFSYLSQWPFSFFDLLLHHPMPFATSTVSPPLSGVATAFFADNTSFPYLPHPSPPSPPLPHPTTTTSPPSLTTTTPAPVGCHHTHHLSVLTGFFNLASSFWNPAPTTASSSPSIAATTSTAASSLSTNPSDRNVASSGSHSAGGGGGESIGKRRGIHRIPASSLLPTFNLSFLQDFGYVSYPPLPATAPTFLLPPPTDTTIIAPPLGTASLEQSVHPHCFADPPIAGEAYPADAVVAGTPPITWPASSSSSSSSLLPSSSRLAQISAVASNFPPSPTAPPVASAAPSMSIPSSGPPPLPPSSRSFLFFNKHSEAPSSSSPSDPSSSSPPPAAPSARRPSIPPPGGRGQEGVIADANLKECLDFCASLRGSQPVSASLWQLLHDSPTCSVWKRKGSSSSEAYEYLARGRFNDISVEAYNVTVSNLGFRQQWDRHIVDIHLIDIYSADKIVSGTRRGGDTYQNADRGISFGERKAVKKHQKGWVSWLGGSSSNSSANDSAIVKASSNVQQQHDVTTTAATTYTHWFPPINPAANSTDIVPRSYRMLSDNKPMEEIIYWRFRIPFPFIQDRDFVYARRFANFVQDNNSRGDSTAAGALSGLVSVQQATTHERGPEKKGECVRIQQYRNGLGLFALPGQTIYDKGMDYVLYHYDDPRSKLPGRVKGYLAATTLPVSMAELHKAAKKLHEKGALPSSSYSSGGRWRDH
eukprot:GHVS01038837.1.p1 GENE.GHVS01038837.1~~GHVS01038837.1.p1  ORF type:complete len:837 (+),score=235.20 GHVS01038837.1:39-2549(+)